MTTARSWSCCEPIIATGRVSHRREVVIQLHSPSCPEPLIRRRTVATYRPSRYGGRAR
jgi:hypothetical protein